MKLQSFFYCQKCGKHTYTETPSYRNAQEGAKHHVNKFHNGDKSLICVGRYDKTKRNKAKL